MKYATIVLLVAAAATALPAREGGYHQLIGIKLAERLRQAEKAADFDGARIVGGSQAQLGAYPYMGGLVVTLGNGQSSVCGSSLISNNRALTAAHCWYDGFLQAEQFTVVLGTTTVFYGGLRIPTRDVITHPNYNTNNFNHDIAIIRMGWVTFTNVIRPIMLPTGALQDESFYGVSAQAAGFGLTSDVDSLTADQYLSHVTLRVISNEECFQHYPNFIINEHICTSGAGRVGPCTSDSGGPLSYSYGGQRILIGVVSFGSVYGCETERPTAYARVSSYIPWIQNYL